ncbi:MAG TPA: DUF1993 domain-containing protein [Steroidobacteraceae bacterium]|nr:DUF1993 domain-containing protein [Steroidobacteraceae bacterium]
MPLSLYDATVACYRQTLEAVTGLLGKAEAFCAEKKLAPETLIQARLAEDMLPFAYQVKSTTVHSLGAIEAVRKGVFSPDMTPPPESFPALKTRIAQTVEGLARIERAEVESFIGRDMAFVFGERRIEFTAESFLLSFTQPNFYFHATTAYDILRAKGVPIGKRDFMGPLRMKK